MQRVDVAVVGAGLAGVAAARVLVDGGFSVVVLDGRHTIGGRLATRQIGAARFDYGAQFFTVRTETFAGVIDRLIADGTVYEWCRGFDIPPDGVARYACRGGMSWLVAAIAHDLDVSLANPVIDLALTDDAWVVSTSEGSVHAEAVVLTPPVPESLDLLDDDVTIDRPLRGRLESISYDPTLSVLVLLDQPRTSALQVRCSSRTVPWASSPTTRQRACPRLLH